MIDIHTHLHPDKLFVAIRGWFAKNTPWKLEHPGTPKDVEKTLRSFGAERFVFCSYAHRTDMARELNAWLCATAVKLNRFGLPLFTVHVDDANYIEDAELALANGCIGLKIHEDVQRFPVDDERLNPIYRELSQRNAFVLAHIGPIPWKRIEKEGVERVKRVATQHPDLKFLIAHMGAPDTSDYLPLIDRFPNLYLDTTMAFSRLVRKDLPISKDNMEKYSGNIVYGSDYPNIPFDYGKELAEIKGCQLSEVALKAILHDNAARLIAPFL
jgi:predicted TIM-barrel fold metal-dependent hydrolase